MTLRQQTVVCMTSHNRIDCARIATPIQSTAERWGSVPRVYIECAADRAISLATQQSMQARLPCKRVLTMSTSHSPFLSDPETLAEHLLSL